VLGLAALTSGSGLPVMHGVTAVDIPLLLAASFAVVLLFQRKSLHRRTGILLLLTYVGYVIFALVRG